MTNHIRKKKIILYIPNSKVSKEYLELFPTDKLSTSYDLVTLYGRAVFDNHKKSYTQLLLRNNTRKFHAFLHRCLLWYKKFSSLSYSLRAFQYFGLRREYDSTSNFLVYNGRRHSVFSRLLIYLFGNYLGVKILSYFLMLLFKLERHKIDSVFTQDTHCVLIPYGGGISLEFDFIVWACETKGIRSLAIQENWDNLSSKSLLLNHPTHFMTWGNQSTSHLRNIQKFTGAIHEIGSLRLNSFYSYRNDFLEGIDISKHNKSSSIFSVLIIGTGPATHDLSLVKYISDYLNSNNAFKFKIYFRPHPYFKNSNFKLDEIRSLENVSIYESSKDEKNDDRIRQLLECSVIVGLYSTVIFEGSILNKPCVIPSFIVPHKGYDTYNFLDDLAHYSGISTLDNIYNAKNELQFWEILSEIREKKITSLNNSKMLNWFCKNTDSKDEIVKYVKNLTP